MRYLDCTVQNDAGCVPGQKSRGAVLGVLRDPMAWQLEVVIQQVSKYLPLILTFRSKGTT